MRSSRASEPSRARRSPDRGGDPRRVARVRLRACACGAPRLGAWPAPDASELGRWRRCGRSCSSRRRPRRSAWCPGSGRSSRRSGRSRCTRLPRWCVRWCGFRSSRCQGMRMRCSWERRCAPTWRSSSCGCRDARRHVRPTRWALRRPRARAACRSARSADGASRGCCCTGSGMAGGECMWARCAPILTRSSAPMASAPRARRASRRRPCASAPRFAMR